MFFLRIWNKQIKIILARKDNEIFILNVLINKKDENINKLQQDVNGLKGTII